MSGQAPTSPSSTNGSKPSNKSSPVSSPSSRGHNGRVVVGAKDAKDDLDMSAVDPNDMTLVYNEPTSSLDNLATEELKTIIYRLRGKFSKLEQAKDLLVSKIREKTTQLHQQQQKNKRSAKSPSKDSHSPNSKARGSADGVDRVFIKSGTPGYTRLMVFLADTQLWDCVKVIVATPHEKSKLMAKWDKAIFPCIESNGELVCVRDTVNFLSTKHNVTTSSLLSLRAYDAEAKLMSVKVASLRSRVASNKQSIAEDSDKDVNRDSQTSAVGNGVDEEMERLQKELQKERNKYRDLLSFSQKQAVGLEAAHEELGDKETQLERALGMLASSSGNKPEQQVQHMQQKMLRAISIATKMQQTLSVLHSHTLDPPAQNTVTTTTPKSSVEYQLRSPSNQSSYPLGHRSPSDILSERSFEKLVEELAQADNDDCNSGLHFTF